MPKRKRSAYEDDGDRVQSMRKKDVSEKLLQSKKLLHRALKTAKGFERQKLGKRLKNAGGAGSNDEVARINREIEALKGLDLDRMTDAQLYKSLLKVKAIAESQLLPEEVRRELPRPEGTEEERKALHNVMSGMWNMKPVREVMEKVMSGMFIAMGIPAPAKNGKGRKKESVKGILKGSVMGVPRRPEIEEADKGLGEERGEIESGEPAWEGFDSGDESEDMDAEGGVKIEDEQNEDSEGDELDEEMLSCYDGLIGGSSDEESFDESKYDLKRSSKPTKRLSLSLSPLPSESPNLSESESQSLSPPPPKGPKAAKAKAPKLPSTKSGSSTFLPTLMGGYWSGSESSASDLEDAIAAPPIRKNRPGQTARRAIWEKKYGERANHIKKGQGSVAEKKSKGKGKDDGWDAKRGAKESTDRNRSWGRGAATGGMGRGRGFARATGENAMPVEPRRAGKRDDIGALHPSWEAAKRAKEAKKTATFQGKKVTFD